MLTALGVEGLHRLLVVRGLGSAELASKLLTSPIECDALSGDGFPKSKQGNGAEK
jgi:hypothetical protein